MFSFFRNHHRKAFLEQPFPDTWEQILTTNFAAYRTLTPEEQDKLRDNLRIFIAEKNWEGAAGIEITDEMQVIIAAQAMFLVLNIEHDFYSNVESIIVYPSDYVAPQKAVGPGGVVEEIASDRLGEAWREGPIVLSWADALEGGRNPHDGHNVVFHEFAHKLDMESGSVDGVPLLHDDAEVNKWAEVMSAEYQELVKQTEHHHVKLLNPYGATNAGEFFAVCTEAFFEKSLAMRETHPRLYRVLADYYRQDPAARLDTADESAASPK